MNFTDAVKTVLIRKYADFSGRAPRSEYWWYVLFLLIAAIVLNIVDQAVFGLNLLGPIFTLATIIPGISVAVRRLHDRDQSGWWLLVSFVPVVGLFIVLYFFVTAGTPGENRFGPEPTV